MKLSGLKQLVEAGPSGGGSLSGGRAGQSGTLVPNTSGYDVITGGFKGLATGAAYAVPALSPQSIGPALFGIDGNRRAASVEAEKQLKTRLAPRIAGLMTGLGATTLPPTKQNLVGRALSSSLGGKMAKFTGALINNPVTKFFAPGFTSILDTAAKVGVRAGLGGHTTGWGTGGAS